MTPPDILFLRHMLDAIDRIGEVVSRTTVERFKADWVIQDATIRELQIPGEAAGRVTREVAESHPEVPWAEITGLRHKLVHDYFVVDLDVVWQTATVDVPAVRSLIAQLVAEVAE
ncbi:MAG: DUF86 domain-containing protein [Gemmatimonadetes bacterium]|nr:DUF86 domain-containing protein [Gemmatimonadota bacterium]